MADNKMAAAEVQHAAAVFIVRVASCHVTSSSCKKQNTLVKLHSYESINAQSNNNNKSTDGESYGTHNLKSISEDLCSEFLRPETKSEPSILRRARNSETTSA